MLNRKLLLCLVLIQLTTSAVSNDLDSTNTESSAEEFIPPETHAENDGKEDEQKPEIPKEPNENNNVDTNKAQESPPVPPPPPQPSNERKVNQGAPTNEKMGRFIDVTNWDSLKSPFAPNPVNQRTDGIGHVITSSRLMELRKEFMYWYWDKGGTNDNEGDYQKNIQSSSPTIHKNLNFQLPFFGFRFNYTRVSLNGYLEFSDPPENYRSYPLVFPNKDWPKKNDPSFIGIFFSKCRIGSLRPEESDQKRPGVYFRMERDLEGRKDVFGVEMRERLKWDIREGVIGAETFNPKHAIIVTWKNVTFAGGISNALFITNTFQMVLATDEVFTYAMFNYLDLQWTTHTEADGDTTTGQGGTPAYIGFNAGNGTRSYEYKPYSQESIIRDLTGRGWANNFPGRHVFRIDENIMMGTCNKDIDSANLPLVIAPESGNMLGGTVVNITGPCFTPEDTIRCKFDVVAEEVKGIYINKNRAVCIQPRLFVEGYINLEISVNSDNYKWKGKYFVEPPASAAEKIQFHEGSVHEKQPHSIKISWQAHNLTTNEAVQVKLSLWGYRERTVKPEFVYIDILEDGIANSGEFVISPSKYRQRDNRNFTDIKFGFLQMNLTDMFDIGEGRTVEVVPIIWSRPIPLGWYFGPQWEREYGERWSRALCDEWIKKDRYLKNFAHELPQCPCSLQHALNDKGRFLPDFNCDKDTNPTCQFNKGAIHCVRSGAPTLEGSEQQCCYDKNGFLMLTYDQQWGSTPFRSHNLGYLPWDEANKVPTLSQWFHDMVPKYLCCIWQDNKATGESGEQSVGCETLRFERRPTQDCVAYQPPAIAGVFGDPHIITFDDLEYTFNGLGEYVLVQAKNKNLRLDVQGRFEQMPMNAYGEVRATQLTAITARGNTSTVIEVRARPRYADWRYRLDVLADGKRVYFDRPSLKYQHFPGVLVYTPNYILNQSEVIVMFDSGAGVEVVENKGFLTARVYLPWKFINQTRGLFGNWSFDVFDDFMDPDGNRISASKTDVQTIYKEFGQKWMLEDKDNDKIGRSLFHREHGKTSSNYNNKTFEPVFETNLQVLIPDNLTSERANAENFCHDYYQCRYDYAMTFNRDLAHFSLNYHSSIRNIKEVNKKQVISCGVLETPRFGRKSNFLFTPGTKVTFECNEHFVLIGDQRRECSNDGRWDIPVYGYSECLRQQEYSARTAGYTTAIVLSVIVTLLIIIAYVGYILFKRFNKPTEGDDTYGMDRKMAASSSYSRASPPDDFYDDDTNSIPSIKKPLPDSHRSLSPSRETEIN